MAAFTQTLWQEIGALHAQILALPFNRELAAGSLSGQTFIHYLIQDAHYLATFARVLALAAAKAPDASAQARLALAANEAITVERALHEDTFARFGVSAASFRASREAPVTMAYGHFLLATAYAEAYPIGLAAVVPCFHIYAEVGRAILAEIGPGNPYRAWTDSYADEAFARTVADIRGLADAAHGAASTVERARMREVYWLSARYEWLFWDSAYRREGWPV